MTTPALLDLGALWAAVAAKGGGNAETLKAYWTTGEGAAKIRWGEGGDFNRCVRLLREETGGAGLDVEGYCANLHHRALGIWPSTHKKQLGAADAPAAGLQVPALVTLPGVDIVAAGTWKLASGEQTFTPADLAHAVHAAQCPAVGWPVIKVGHVDPRFDGEPAVGRVLNMALTAEGNKITGDLAGMPGWLGAVAASAYPRRSIEGTYDFQCQIGHLHPFVITGLALLGVTPPGVGVLGGLRDVAGLYGVQAAAAQGGTWRLDGAGGDMTTPVTARAVTELDVRRAYYESPGVAMSLWITELQMDPAQLIVADEATSKVYRVPFHIEAGAVKFGEATEVSVAYADIAASRGTGAAIVYASAAESRNVAAADTPGEEETCPACGGEGKLAGKTCPECNGTGKVEQQGPAQAAAPDPPASPDPPAAPDVVAAWDGGAAVAAMGADPSAGAIKAMFAIPRGSKSDSSLPHHSCTGGKVGAANPDGCSAAIAALNGARGGMTGVSESQARAAYSHLAAHLRAAGRTPPPYSGAGSSAASGPGIKIDAAGRHGTYTGTHSHPHAALGHQGGDETHDHSHAHKGDGRHAHVHAAGTTEGGSEVDFTEDQMTALRSAFGLGEDEELTAENLVQAAGALRERADQRQVAASRALPPGVITVEQEAWDALHRRVQQGEEYRSQQLRGQRDQVIAAAVRAGKFSTAQVPKWERIWDRDPDSAREVIASLQSNVVPTDDIGTPGGEEDTDSDYRRVFSKDYVEATRRPGA